MSPRVNLPIPSRKSLEMGETDLMALHREFLMSQQSSMEGQGLGCGSDCGCSPCQTQAKLDAAYARAGLSGFGALNVGGVATAGQAGMSFINEPSWEGAAKLADASTKATDIAKSECKPDPVVMAIASGAAALLTGGMGLSAGVGALLATAASVVPGVITNAIGCDSGKKKMTDALRKCFESMNPQILYSSLKICPANSWGKGTIRWTGQTQEKTCAAYNGAWVGAVPDVSSNSEDARARIQSFYKLCIEYFGSGRDIKDAVISALYQAQSETASGGSAERTAQWIDQAKKATGATVSSVKAAGGAWDLKQLVSYAGGEDKLYMYLPGWEAIYQIAKKCIEGTIVAATAAAVGQPVPADLSPTVQIDSLQGSKSILPWLLLVGGVVLVGAAAKRRQQGGEEE